MTARKRYRAILAIPQAWRDAHPTHWEQATLSAATLCYSEACCAKAGERLAAWLRHAHMADLSVRAAHKANL